MARPKNHGHSGNLRQTDKRERMAQLVAEGKSNSEIAALMGYANGKVVAVMKWKWKLGEHGAQVHP